MVEDEVGGRVFCFCWRRAAKVRSMQRTSVQLDVAVLSVGTVQVERIRRIIGNRAL